MNYDLHEIRSRFPALSIQDRGKRRIYFDNPAGTQVSQQVVNAMQDCLIGSNANIQGGFETSNRVDQILADARQAMADLLNANSTNEIIFGQNMTTLTLHFSRSLGRLFSSGDEIILSKMDHDANISPWLLLAEDLNLKIKWLTFDNDSFEFNVNDLDTLLTSRTKLVCVGGASNLLGTINDIKTISKKAKSVGALCYVDAVQLAPHVAIDVQDIGCDFLVCSSYKFFGPHQGILWGKKEVMSTLELYKVRPATDQLPSCFETGTQSHEGIAGITAAIDYFTWVGKEYAQDFIVGVESQSQRTKVLHGALDYLLAYEAGLTKHLIDGLLTIKNLKIQGVTSTEAIHRRLPTVSFTVANCHSSEIAAALAKENIFVWSGHSYALEVVKSLTLLDSGGVVRVGPVHYNGIEEIDDFIEVLGRITTHQN